MKRLIYILIVAALFGFYSCEDVTDEFKGLEEESSITNVQQIDITLSAKDYEAIGGVPGEKGYFSIAEQPAKYIPDFLDSKYLTLDTGSVINVTYNYLDEDNLYELSDDDYEAAGQKYSNFGDESIAEASIVILFNSTPEFMTKSKGFGITVKYVLTSKDDTRYVKVNEDFSTEVLDEEPDDYYELDDDDYDLLDESDGDFYSISVAESKVASFAQMPEGKGAGNYACIVYRSYYDKYMGIMFNGANWYRTGNTYTVISKTDQFMLKAEGWSFDPTILLTMASFDYQAIVEYVLENHGDSYINSYGTADYYFGADSYFKNFNIRESGFENDEFSSWEEAVSTGIAVGLLPVKYPEAVPEIGGFDVPYIVTFDTYNGSDATYSMEFACTKAGPSPEFEYVEGALTLK